MQTIGDVMTRDPLTIDASAPVSDAAQIMRDYNIGDVMVIKSDGSLGGIVTDRDLTLRVVAPGYDPKALKVEDVCSDQVTSIAPGQPVAEAVDMMRDQAIRRLAVVEDGHLVGVVSLGDLAMERDPRSALADISEAPPNN
jgi:signal-transduction protein with cAMP-binding, CBS, and nucleotidyltransferase domain